MILEEPGPIVLNQEKYLKEQSNQAKVFKENCYPIQKPYQWSQGFGEPCQLYSEKPENPLPLESINYEAAINGGLAQVVLSQNYTNNSGGCLNVKYQFPVNDQIVFSDLEVIFKNKVIKGQIKMKAQARHEYQQHLAVGNVVAYAEQLSEKEDVMVIKIGNFPGGEKLQIRYTYLTKLDIINECFWGFRIPSTLTPLCDNRPESQMKPAIIYPLLCNMDDDDDEPIELYGIDNGMALESGQPPVSDSDASEQLVEKITTVKAYTWEINIKFFFNPEKGIPKISSLSHQNSLIYSSNNNIFEMRFKPELVEYPNKDFELMIEDGNLFANSCLVAKHPGISGAFEAPKYAAMMQFVPSMYEWYAKDQSLNKAQGISQFEERHDDFLMDSCLSEYIFILDRSGSMKGEKLINAKNAVKYFLRSLPQTAKFNIVSFGSTFEPMFRTSQDCSAFSLDNALRRIQRFRANMRSTNILDPLQYAFDLPQIPRYQRNVFLLTDGSVKNTKEILNSIEINCMYNRSRLFTIGVGTGASDYLVRKAATLGNGKSVMILCSEGIEDKVVSLLTESMTPSLTNFEVEYDEEMVAALTPLPNQSSHIIRGEPFIMFALLNDVIQQTPTLSTSVKIKFFDSSKQAFEERIFKLTVENSLIDSSFHKLCTTELVRDNSRLINHSYMDFRQMVGANSSSTSQMLTNLCLSYQVLSPQLTAFICLVDERVGNKIVRSEDVIVANLRSVNQEPHGHKFDHQEVRTRGTEGKKSKPDYREDRFGTRPSPNKNRGFDMDKYLGKGSNEDYQGGYGKLSRGKGSYGTFGSTTRGASSGIRGKQNRSGMGMGSRTRDLGTDRGGRKFGRKSGNFLGKSTSEFGFKNLKTANKPGRKIGPQMNYGAEMRNTRGLGQSTRPPSELSKSYISYSSLKSAFSNPSLPEYKKKKYKVDSRPIKMKKKKVPTKAKVNFSKVKYKKKVEKSRSRSKDRKSGKNKKTKESLKQLFKKKRSMSLFSPPKVSRAKKKKTVKLANRFVSNLKKSVKKTKTKTLLDDLVALQRPDGSWAMDNRLFLRLGAPSTIYGEFSTQINNNQTVLMTLVATAWLSKQKNMTRIRLILRKAKRYLKNKLGESSSKLLQAVKTKLNN